MVKTAEQDAEQEILEQGHIYFRIVEPRTRAYSWWAIKVVFSAPIRDALGPRPGLV